MLFQINGAYPTMQNDVAQLMTRIKPTPNTDILIAGKQHVRAAIFRPA